MNKAALPTRLTIGSGLILASLAGLTRCGGGSGSATGPAGPSTTTTPAPTTDVARTTAAPALSAPTSAESTTTTPASSIVPTTSPPTTTAPGGPTECSPDEITTSTGTGGAGLSHVGLPLLFTNHGGTTCTLTGYPGVALLDSNGNQVLQAQRTPAGYLGGLPSGTITPPVNTLEPGQTVAALLEGTDATTGTATTCPTYPALLVTPPNQTVSVTVHPQASADGTGFLTCGTPQIHPVIPGTTGRDNN